MGFNFEIAYNPGASNRVADALSRCCEKEVELQHLSSTHEVKWDELDREVRQDKLLTEVKQRLMAGEEVLKGFTLEHGQLRHKGRFVLPKTSSFIDVLLNEYHDSPIGGHAGENKTYSRLATNWFWEGMRKRVAAYVKACGVCQKQKTSTLQLAGLLQPLPIPSQIWEHISLDFVEGLPMSQGKNSVLVVVDRLSKYAHFIGLKHPYTASSVAAVFVREIVRLHGYPTSIVSDRDKIFLSHFWRELFKLQGTQLKRSTTYHPQSDGQTEVVNKTLETCLRCFINGKPKEWHQWLHWAEYSYNTSSHTSTKTSPFVAVYGRQPPHLSRVSQGDTAIGSLDALLQERDAILDELKFHLLRAQVMKANEDKHRRPISFLAGDWVFLKLQPYQQRSLARKLNEKLAPRFYGPYRVVKCIGTAAYELALPPTSRIHPVFHVSQLKKAVGQLVPSDIPEELTVDLEMLTTPCALLDWRYNTGGHLEVLIQWENLPKSEATW